MLARTQFSLAQIRHTAPCVGSILYHVSCMPPVAGALTSHVCVCVCVCVQHIVALTREFDLCSTWNKFCVESVVAETHSDMEMLCIAVRT